MITAGGHVRDVEAVGRFELFFVSAVATVIVTRGFLIVTGYPRVGGGGLHVAHVLYGGLLMAVSILVLEIAPGSRARQRAAVIGGIGFGLFIDEVGKFLTKDVNYFYRPAIAIIYTVFVAFFLVVRELVLRRSLNDARRLAVASGALSDLALGQLHEDHRRHALNLLTGVSSHPQLHHAIHQGLQSEAPHGEQHAEVRLSSVRNRVGDHVRRAVCHRHFDLVLGLLMVLGIAGYVAEFALLVFDRHAGSNTTVVVAGIASTGLSAPYVAFGLWRLHRGDRCGALRVFFRTTLAAVLFSQIFLFFEFQAAGIIGAAYGLVILGGIRLLAESADEALVAAQPAGASGRPGAELAGPAGAGGSGGRSVQEASGRG